jgi:NAD(P)-dependent dehydrogenase (short-subunit alcohol dehydrogenase family)
MKEFKGRTAFITGGAEGIGYHIGRVLAKEGMKVMLGDIDGKVLEGAVKTLKGEGLNVEGLVFDVALKEDWVAAAKKITETFGNVHLLVSNAGVALTGSQKNFSEDDWRWIIDVNIMGIVYGAQVFAPLMKDHGEGGHIMNVASIAGTHGVSFSGPYCATKAAVVSLSECWRKEFEKDGIGVSVLCPGFVKSRVYDSKRNRQARYGGPEYYEDIIKTKPAQKYNKELCVTGIDTDIAGNRVLEALKNDEFYVFTHPHYRVLHEFRVKNLTKAFDDADASPALATVSKKEGVVIY